MSNLEKEIVSNLESGIENVSSFEFGAPDLNDMYKKLEQTIKEDFDKIPTKEIKIDVLKRMNNPDIQEVYKNLNEIEKAKIDKLKIRDKYSILAQLAKDKKNKKEAEEKGKFKPKTPDITRAPSPPEQKFKPRTPDIPPPNPNTKPPSPLEEPAVSYQQEQQEELQEEEQEEKQEEKQENLINKEIISLFINIDKNKIINIWKFVFVDPLVMTSIKCIGYNKYSFNV